MSELLWQCQFLSCESLRWWNDHVPYQVSLLCKLKVCEWCKVTQANQHCCFNCQRKTLTLFSGYFFILFIWFVVRLVLSSWEGDVSVLREWISSYKLSTHSEAGWYTLQITWWQMKMTAHCTFYVELFNREVKRWI